MIEVTMDASESVDVHNPRRFEFPAGDKERLTHYLFRYPAKFHPPVVRQLIATYVHEGATVLDPFCGSGTLLVEAGVCGRSARGLDVDPLAVFVSRVKAHRYRVAALRESCANLLKDLGELARPDSEYERRQHEDVTPETVERTVKNEGLFTPKIPGVFHWFRRYVVVDLARILHTIHEAEIPETHREFLRLCFAAIIRGASNADPVPVSGLEVTSHMKKRDEEGRVVNPFELLRRAVERALDDVEAFQGKLQPGVQLSASQGDATALSSYVVDPADVVITSPPYNVAVDYYRRHLLEMYWLGFTKDHDERLALLPKYIGRHQVPQRHPYVANGAVTTPLVKTWDAEIRQAHQRRADAFKHYVVAMGKAMEEISKSLKAGGRALFVVGQSRWNGKTIPTDALFVELAGSSMKLVDHLWYPVSNRYMSYSRHNGANIDKEYVLVFQKPK